MSSSRTLTLTLWYSTLFVVGSLIIVVVTYAITAARFLDQCGSE